MLKTRFKILPLLISTSLSGVLLISGCAQYPRYKGLSSDISRTPEVTATQAGSLGRKDTNVNVTKDASPPPVSGEQRFAGDIESAMDAIDHQRNLYFDEVSGSSEARQIAGSSLIGLSAWAVYKGVRSDSDSTKRLLALAGATGAAAYGISTHLQNSETEKAFLLGYRALTCLLVKSRPLLIEQAEFKTWSKDVDDLRDKITDVDKALSVAQTHRYQGLEAAKNNNRSDPQPYVDREFHHLYDALKKARTLLETSHVLQARVATAGFALRRRAELVVADVSTEVQRNEHDIPKLEGLVTTTSNITKTFAAIKPIEPGDTGADDLGNKGNAPAPAPNGGDAQKVEESPKVAPATPETIGKQVDELVKKNKDLVAKNKNLAKENKELKSKPKAVDDADKKVREAERVCLRKLLSSLYAQHRKVNLMLSNFAALNKSVKDVEQCTSGSGTFLTISPSVDELTVQPSQQYQFSISGGAGIPKAWLIGAKSTDDANQMKLVMTVEGDSVVATVTVPAKPPTGTSYLVITDGSGKQREEIALNIAKAAPKKENESSNTQ